MDHGRILVCDIPEALKRSVATAATVELRLKALPSPRLFQQLEALHGVEGVLAEENRVKVLTSARDGLVPQLIAKVGSGLLDLSVSETMLETCSSRLPEGSSVTETPAATTLSESGAHGGAQHRYGNLRAEQWRIIPASFAALIARDLRVLMHMPSTFLLRSVLNPRMFVFVFT